MRNSGKQPRAVSFKELTCRLSLTAYRYLLLTACLLATYHLPLTTGVEARIFLSEGETGTHFLTIPTAARPQALGNAYVAIGKDVYSLEYNPAGLSFIEDNQFSASHLFLFRNANYTSLSYAHPTIENFGFGLRYRTFYANDTSRDITGTNTGKFQVKDDGVTLATSYKIFEVISIGISGEYLDRKLAEFSSRGIAWGIGVQYLHPSKKQAYGASLLNLGTPLKFVQEEEPLPTTIRAGGAHAMGRTLFSEKNDEESEIGKGVIFSWDLQRVRDEFDYTTAAGIEWWIFNPFAFRIGIRLREEVQVSGGFGLLWQMLSLDFAVRQQRDLGFAQSISLLIRF